jgi:hypothetical protein
MNGVLTKKLEMLQLPIMLKVDDLEEANESKSICSYPPLDNKFVTPKKISSVSVLRFEFRQTSKSG